MASSITNSFKLTDNIQNCHLYQFRWLLENFHNIKTEICSKTFSVDECNVQWQLSLNFGNGFGNKILASLHRADAYDKTVEAHLIIEVQNFSERTYSKASIESFFPPSSKFSAYLRKPSASKINRVLDDAISAIPIFFDHQIIIKACVTICRCCNGDISMTIPALFSKDLLRVLKNQEFCDVSLKVGDDVIGAHKIILCARSPVLKKMFQHDLEESLKNVIEFTDTTKDVLSDFLIFLYSGKIARQNFDIVTVLYSMADKYEVSTLQNTCGDILKSSMSKTTVLVILKLSDMHSDEVLEEAALDFICKNFEKVASTNEWNDMLDSDPRLASLTLKRMTKCINSRQRNAFIE